MEFNRLTWIGLIVAAFGWGVLLLGATASEGISRAWEYFGRTAPDLSVVSTSNSMIVSGFGLAILGALQSGFGALQRFFEAVLQRSQRVQAQPASAMNRPAELPTNEVAERGRIGDRAYVRFANGTIQIETLLGVRNFASFEEARKFIGT